MCAAETASLATSVGLASVGLAAMSLFDACFSSDDGGGGGGGGGFCDDQPPGRRRLTLATRAVKMEIDLSGGSIAGFSLPGEDAVNPLSWVRIPAGALPGRPQPPLACLMLARAGESEKGTVLEQESPPFRDVLLSRVGRTQRATTRRPKATYR